MPSLLQISLLNNQQSLFPEQKVIVDDQETKANFFKVEELSLRLR